VVRYLGYTTPSTATAGVGKGQDFQFGINDAARQLTDVQMRGIAALADQYRATDVAVTSALNIKGTSDLVKGLPYVDAKTVWILPFAHAFLHGIVKGFLAAILTVDKKKKMGRQQQQQQQQQQPLGLGGRGILGGGRGRGRGANGRGGGRGPGAQATEEAVLPKELRVGPHMRKIMLMRALGFTLHPQNNRPYRDIVNQRGLWTMECTIRALEIFLPVVFWPFAAPETSTPTDVLPPAIKKAWGHLRRFGHFHLNQPPPFDPSLPADQQAGLADQVAVDAAADAAGAELLEFAKMAQMVRASSSYLLNDCRFVVSRLKLIYSKHQTGVAGNTFFAAMC
jgi:hypothetical protein